MIAIENYSYTYTDGVQALQGITLSLSETEHLGIVGANGAGKSTLLHALVGILDFGGESGKIIVDEIARDKKSLAEIRKKIGIVFQNPDDQLFMNRVYDDIAFGLRNQSINEEKIVAQVEKIMQDFSILHLKDRHSHKLSFGEKRSCAMASVLICNPQYFVLDEPSCFLDPRSRRNLIERLQKIPIAAIIATHDLDLVKEVCSRVIVLKNGTVFADGKPAEIFSKEDLLFSCGLELPLAEQNCKTCSRIRSENRT